MDSLQVNYFLELCKYLNFTKTSEVLFVSQSSISKKIKQLENELGFALFKRDNKRVVLTENGEFMREILTRQKQELSFVIENCKSLESNTNKKISIGIIAGWNIAKVIEKFDDVSFNNYLIESEKISSLLTRLLDKKIDIVIGSKLGILQDISTRNLKGITYKKVIEIPRICYFSVNHPKAFKENLTLKDFKDDILYRGFSRVAQEVCIDVCGQEGFIPKTSSMLNYESILLKLSHGQGYAIGDYFLRVRTDTDFKHLLLSSKQEIAIAYLNDLEDVDVLHFIDEIIKNFKNTYNSILE